MYAEERQAQILEEAATAGRVEVAALAERLGVTPETVRRDLTTLERHGGLRRVHGGAIPVERLPFELGLAVREGVNIAEKERIATSALAEVPVEGVIGLDAGTTTLRLAEALPTDRLLTVVTNGLPQAMLLVHRPNITLHVTGGRIRSRTLAAVDEAAQDFLRHVVVDVFFLGTNGISVARGLTTPDRSEAAVKRAMLACARHSVVLADHTKFHSDYFACFGSLAEVDVVVTDSKLENALAEEIAEAGPKVVRA